MKQKQTRHLIIVGMLSAISVVLMFIKFPLPFLPPYLTIDFSDVPSLLATFTLGPIAGVLVELIKNLLNFFFNVSDPVGPVANFLAGTTLLLVSYWVYQSRQTTRQLIIGLIVGTLAMTVLLSVLNYFVLLPLFGMIMNLADVANNLKLIIAAGIIPFNIIKGALVSVIFILLYKRIGHILK
ncbi:ECF transporter S component [Staphylococcus schleiferi]|uniref:ECF transporter S component n=1 Tax=Staphylococcus schleiferi TaxID=1295 RepID=UPI0014302099|nr:ECF transporter S component [Staphylococcus schleiferi]QPA23327.1 ECF transporter S component [Mammaliicoccus fleurettii]MBF1992233.1 ECF transporter S component [Staphylococcus schleiferi]MBF2037829.1 ECF transporter S component [Staphylococcus schleiferi]MBF2100167.1 ECF transporter S component [Staphylococcus schleiferi]MBF2101944.1 ECF transporter S component [Staphylococcus schleiferi]